MTPIKWREISLEHNTYKNFNTEENFQWWYWDAFLKDGTTIMVAWLPRAIGKIKNVSLDPLSPEIWIDVREPNGVLHSIKKAYPLKNFEYATVGLKAKMGENSIVSNNGVH